MAGLGKFLGGVVSGGLVAGLTLVGASQLSQPTRGDVVAQEDTDSDIVIAQDAAADSAVAPVKPATEAVDEPVVPQGPVSDAAPLDAQKSTASLAADALQRPDVDPAVTTPQDLAPAAEVAAGAIAENEAVAVSDVPPTAPATALPAQSAPAQSALAQSALAQSAIARADTVPVPQTEAAATLTAQLQAPPVVSGVDTAPSPAELPPQPPLSAEEEAGLSDPARLALPVVEDDVILPDNGTEAPETDEVAVVSPIITAPAPVQTSLPEPEAEADPVAPIVVAEDATPVPKAGFAEDGPSTLPATRRLITEGEGSLIDRNAAEAEQAAAEPAIVLAEDDPADATALTKFAADFSNPDNKPLFGIVLVDNGDVGLDRQAVATLPFAVSIVIDPLMPNAADYSALYRAGGKEVIMLASGIPEGATPSDVEQTFQSLAAVLPEAVAVIDSAAAAFQNDRPLSTQIVPILAAQGRGLLTWDRGLNAADQVARREGLPTATIFRQIDAEGEDVPVMRRYLDRAAFKAAQEGKAIVLGTIRPQTVAALLEWAIEGRASTVALAPASAFLQAN